MSKRALEHEQHTVLKIPKTKKNASILLQFRKAVEDGDYDAVNTMILQGSLHQLKDSKKSNLINTAARRCYYRIIQRLLEAGVVPFVRTHLNHVNPLQYAAGCTPSENKTHTFRILLSAGCTVNDTLSDGHTPLFTCAIINDFITATDLLAHGADTTIELDTGCTALHLTRSSEMATLLIRHGACVNASSVRGETPLHFAVLMRRTDVARVLLENGAFPDALTAQGKTPLMIACSDVTPIEIIQLLVQFRASPNLFHSDGLTPFHTAISRNFTEAIDFFLDFGVDPTTPTKFTNLKCDQLAHSAQHFDLALRLHHLQHFCELAKQGNIQHIKKIILSEPIPQLNPWINMIPFNKKIELRLWVQLTRDLETNIYASFFNHTVDEDTSMQSEVDGPVAELLAQMGVFTSAISRNNIHLLLSRF